MSAGLALERDLAVPMRDGVPFLRTYLDPLLTIPIPSSCL